MAVPPTHRQMAHNVYKNTILKSRVSKAIRLRKLLMAVRWTVGIVRIRVIIVHTRSQRVLIGLFPISSRRSLVSGGGSLSKLLGEE